MLWYKRMFDYGKIITKSQILFIIPQHQCNILVKCFCKDKVGSWNTQMF